MPFTFKDNSGQVLSELDLKTIAGLEACGGQAVSHSKQIVNAAGRIDTGNLINGISHKVQNKICFVGTNTRYAIYNEMGTGIYIAGGRKSPWSYKDSEGKWHRTRGMRPIHFIKNSLANFIGEYKKIFMSILKG